MMPPGSGQGSLSPPTGVPELEPAAHIHLREGAAGRHYLTMLWGERVRHGVCDCRGLSCHVHNTKDEGMRRRSRVPGRHCGLTSETRNWKSTARGCGSEICKEAMASAPGPRHAEHRSPASVCPCLLDQLGDQQLQRVPRGPARLVRELGPAGGQQQVQLVAPQPVVAG